MAVSPVGGAKVACFGGKKPFSSSAQPHSSLYSAKPLGTFLTINEKENTKDAGCQQMERHYLIESNFTLHICQLLQEMLPDREWDSLC